MEFLVLLKLVCFLLIHLIFKGEYPTYVISIKNKVNVGLYSDIYRPISFTLGVMIETTKLYI